MYFVKWASAFTLKTFQIIYQLTKTYISHMTEVKRERVKGINRYVRPGSEDVFWTHSIKSYFIRS